MKRFRAFFSWIVLILYCFTTVACQTPLYKATKRLDVAAVKRELASGGDPNESGSAANLFWQVPLLPLTVAFDIPIILLCGDKYKSSFSLTVALFESTWDTPVDCLRESYGLDRFLPDIDAPHFGHVEVNAISDLSAYSSSLVGQVDKDMICAFVESGKIDNDVWKCHAFNIALEKKDYTLATRLLGMGVNPNVSLRLPGDTVLFAKDDGGYYHEVTEETSFLAKAFSEGDAEKVRFLVNAGADINMSTEYTSCQFEAQQGGLLSLYRELGGVVVDKPAAPPVDCDECRWGDTGGYRVVSTTCGKCRGSGKKRRVYEDIDYVVGSGSTDPNAPGNIYSNPGSAGRYVTTTRTEITDCEECGGSGTKVYREHEKCRKCAGQGKISRYWTSVK